MDAKTAVGIAHWRPNRCVGQLRSGQHCIDLGLPDMSIKEASTFGVRTLVLGSAILGGGLRAEWIDTIAEALLSGLDVASGLHTRISAVPPLVAASAKSGSKIIEVRKTDHDLPIATNRKRSGKRLLTVGTDCSVGKMYTALSLESEMKSAGFCADFRATGQTGILISGSGIPIDAVVADFLPGAVEVLSPDSAADHWDVIEGQGSLFHPSFAGVSLGLLHGSQPDALVLCHEAGRIANSDFPNLPLPGLKECAELNLQMARMVNPQARLAGFSLNTRTLDDDEAYRSLRDAEATLSVPAIDPIRTGVTPILEELAKYS